MSNLLFNVNVNCLHPNFFNPDKKVFCTDQQKNYLKQLKDYDQFNKFCLDHNFIMIKCNKCELCKQSKINKINYRVKEQIRLSQFNYLLTLTFDNKVIKKNYNFMKIDQDYDQISTDLFTTVSKVQISNIIRNLKKKLNNYYKTNVKFNYLLCGEYGSRTERAHYHIVLCLDHQIPELKKISNIYYLSNFLISKQYSNYNLQIIDPNNPKVGYYLSKYLLKSNLNLDKRFVKYNIQDERFVLKTFGYLIKSQLPFIKKSRNLGMTGDFLNDFKNGVLSNYYFKKNVLTYIDHVDQRIQSNLFNVLQYYPDYLPKLEQVYYSFQKSEFKIFKWHWINSYDQFVKCVQQIAIKFKNIGKSNFIRYFRYTKLWYLYYYLINSSCSFNDLLIILDKYYQDNYNLNKLSFISNKSIYYVKSKNIDYY